MVDTTVPLLAFPLGSDVADPATQSHWVDWTPFTYPPLLLTGGLNDTRVGFWEPAKLVARLRHLNPDNPALLRMEMGVGHGGPSGRYDSWREEAYVLAWILERLGLSDVTPARGA